nr:reverse transcriptase domain-containing protein [Tanacetum cinerariifolium]
MTDSGNSTVSYTLISSPERSWDIPDVDLYEEADLQAIDQVAPPLSPAYLPDPVELDENVPVYVPKPEYPEYLKPPADIIVDEDQPYADGPVPTALSAGYITDSNLEEDPKEDPKEEENADYTNETKEEDPEEEGPEEEDPEEKESDDNAASEEEPSEGSDDIEPFEEDETAVTLPPSRLRGARISIHPQTPMPPFSEARVAELLAMPTPPPSPLTLMSSLLPQIPSPPFPVPSPPPIPSSPLPPPVPVETHASKQDVAAALLMLPSTTRRSEVPETDMPPRKILYFATPTTGFEVGDSSAAAAARPPRDLYGFDDDRYEAQTRQRNGEEFHSQLRDAQLDRASIRAEIVALRDRGTILEDAYIELHEDLLRSEARNESFEAQNKSLVVRIETIETRMTEMEDQFQDTKDLAVNHMIRTQALEARAQIDTMEDVGRRTSNNMTPEAVQAMLNQAMQRNSTNGDESHSSRGGPTRPVQSVCACSYSDVMKYQPLNLRGTKGVVGLSRWFEKMESVFHISDCAVENQVKFATCTMLDAALNWWNGHVRTLGHDAAYAMTWETLKNKLTDKYCPKGKIKKLEIEMWNLKVRENDVAAYTQCFQELALMCTKFLTDETENVNKYISGLPDNIHENVMSERPKTLDEAIELANDLMDRKLHTYAERQNDNKRKADDL